VNQERQAALAAAEQAREELARVDSIPSGFLADMAALASARREAQESARLKKMGLRVERAVPPLDPEKMAMLLRARDAHRARAKAREDDKEVAAGRAAAVEAAMGGMPSSPSPLQATSTTSASHASHASSTSSAAAVSPPKDMWGYLEELEEDRGKLMAEYTRPLPFATKGSRVLGRRHLQVKEESRAFQAEIERKALEQAKVEAERAALEESIARRKFEATQQMDALVRRISEGRTAQDQ
jgi:hypothetical protein